MQTCGLVYRSLWHKIATGTLCNDAPDSAYAPYGVGFMAGQAEKVYSGTVPAFMIRPGADWWVWSCEAMRLVCGHYGLDVYEDTAHGEIWGCGEENTMAKIHSVATKTQENGTHWHVMRALFCGIPHERVDIAYHERPGYRIRCEPER